MPFVTNKRLVYVQGGKGPYCWPSTPGSKYQDLCIKAAIEAINAKLNSEYAAIADETINPLLDVNGFLGTPFYNTINFSPNMNGVIGKAFQDAADIAKAYNERHFNNVANAPQYLLHTEALEAKIQERYQVVENVYSDFKTIKDNSYTFRFSKYFTPLDACFCEDFYYNIIDIPYEISSPDCKKEEKEDPEKTVPEKPFFNISNINRGIPIITKRYKVLCNLIHIWDYNRLTFSVAAKLENQKIVRIYFKDEKIFDSRELSFFNIEFNNNIYRHLNTFTITLSPNSLSDTLLNHIIVKYNGQVYAEIEDIYSDTFVLESTHPGSKIGYVSDKMVVAGDTNLFNGIKFSVSIQLNGNNTSEHIYLGNSRVNTTLGHIEQLNFTAYSASDYPDDYFIFYKNGLENLISGEVIPYFFGDISFFVGDLGITSDFKSIIDNDGDIYPTQQPNFSVSTIYTSIDSSYVAFLSDTRNKLFIYKIIKKFNKVSNIEYIELNLPENVLLPTVKTSISQNPIISSGKLILITDITYRLIEVDCFTGEYTYLSFPQIPPATDPYVSAVFIGNKVYLSTNFDSFIYNRSVISSNKTIYDIYSNGLSYIGINDFDDYIQFDKDYFIHGDLYRGGDSSVYETFINTVKAYGLFEYNVGSTLYITDQVFSPLIQDDFSQNSITRESEFQPFYEESNDQYFTSEYSAEESLENISTLSYINDSTYEEESVTYDSEVKKEYYQISTNALLSKDMADNSLNNLLLRFNEGDLSERTLSSSNLPINLTYVSVLPNPFGISNIGLEENFYYIERDISSETPPSQVSAKEYALLSTGTTSTTTGVYGKSLFLPRFYKGYARNKVRIWDGFRANSNAILLTPLKGYRLRKAHISQIIEEKLVIKILDPSITLSSRLYEEIIDNKFANLFSLDGKEWLQFTNAVELSPGVYELSGILRGRFSSMYNYEKDYFLENTPIYIYTPGTLENYTLNNYIHRKTAPFFFESDLYHNVDTEVTYKYITRSKLSFFQNYMTGATIDNYYDPIYWSESGKFYTEFVTNVSESYTRYYQDYANGLLNDDLSDIDIDYLHNNFFLLRGEVVDTELYRLPIKNYINSQVYVNSLGMSSGSQIIFKYNSEIIYSHLILRGVNTRPASFKLPLNPHDKQIDMDILHYA